MWAAGQERAMWAGEWTTHADLEREGRGMIPSLLSAQNEADRSLHLPPSSVQVLGLPVHTPHIPQHGPRARRYVKNRV